MSDFDPRGLGADEAASHPLLGLLLQEMWGDHPAPSLEVDPRDEMLAATRELCHGRRDAALVEYFLAGISAARTLEPLLQRLTEARRSRPENRPPRVLDFAAGWGRVTRFLAAAHPEIEIAVSDISPQAVAFQQRVLGRPGFVSAARPGELRVPGGPGFDAVLIASLFTHLPERTFLPWLQRLWALVAPGGVLAVSTHPEERLPEGLEMPSSGLFYEAASEIPHLDVGDYGRTWVTADFMERAVQQAVSPAQDTGLHLRRFRRCLWHLQDLWLIRKEPAVSEGTAVEGLAMEGLEWEGLELNGGPDGRLEGLAFEDDGSRLWLGGWAAHPFRDDPELRVEVRVNGRTVASVRPDRPRPDVAERFGRPELASSGWLLDVPLQDGPLGNGPGTNPILVRGVDTRGRAHGLHLSTLEGLVAWDEARKLREELASCRAHLKAADGHLRVDAVKLRDLRVRLEAMEASRFWKLRNAWHGLKDRLGRRSKPGVLKKL